jgi:hypothetical protein
MARTHVFGPYPELLEASPVATPFEIRNALDEALPTTGMVDLGKRVMWVPLEASARPVTRHELGHVAWSPRKPVRLPFDPRVLMAIEDARVNLGLAGLRLPVVLDVASHAHVVMLLAEDAKAGDGFALFMRAIASLGTSVEAALEEQLEATPGPFGEIAVRWMGRVRGELEVARIAAGGPVAPHAKGVELAHALARELRALGFLDVRGRARSRAPSGCCIGHGGGGLVPPEGFGPSHRPEYDAARAEVRPGRLVVKEAPLRVPLRNRRSGRSWRAAEEGSVPRYFTRWPVDRAVFRRRARRSGGTLLVDTSGSMSLEVADLDRLLLATPHGMRVAIYSGTGEEGELRIVADGGRRASAAHLARYGSGNIVDLPALEWLAKQSLPRLWVSDGAVTGVGDKGSEALRRRCEALCRRSRIRRVAKLDEAAALLRAH